MKVQISIVKELIEEWNADINARDNGYYRGQKMKTNQPISAYLSSHGGIM